MRQKRTPWYKKVTTVIPGVLLLLFVGGGIGYAVFSPNKAHAAHDSPVSTAPIDTKKTATPAVTKPAITTTACSNNAIDQNVIVSISQRHMWACAGSVVAYDSPVVTGMENLAADLTPVGVYHIYGKETDLDLKGSDSTGSWDDPVSYWMPFLDNQYGAYGFHDATWRSPSDFGTISPDSSNASHGCVELPLATASWLYKWAVVGTTVTIES